MIALFSEGFEDLWKNNAWQTFLLNELSVPHFHTLESIALDMDRENQGDMDFSTHVLSAEQST